MRCAFPACDHDSSQNLSPRVTFHRIPDEESLRAAWMEALGQTDWMPEPGSVVCSEHILVMDLLGTSTEHSLQLCRICFTTDCKMYSMTSFKTLNEAYETVTGILTAEEEHLPRYLCAQCAGRLMNCARFRRRSLRAHSMLLDIVRTHGQITVELIRSALQHHNPFSSYVSDDPNEEYLNFDSEEFEELNKQTDAQTNSPFEEVDMYEEINNIKSEEDFDHSIVNSKDKSNDVTAKEVKIENEGVNNEGELNACTSDFNADIDEDRYDPISQDNRSRCSSNSDEDVDVIGIVRQNDMTNRDNDSECSFSSAEDTNVDVVTTDNDGIITPNIFVGEDILDDLPTLEDEEVSKTRRVVNEVEADDQQTPEADGPSADDTLRCDICHYQTGSDIQLLEHLKAHAASNNVRQKRNLQTHQLKHSREKSYTCDVCKKVFRLKGILTNHLLLHFKTYSCDVCNKMFSRRYSLKNHMLIHSNEKPYSCGVCNKMFRQKCNLITHQLIHSNLKPYSCDVCNKMFSQKSALIRHQLIHSNVKPYSCDVCKKMFRRKDDIIRHHQLLHSNVKPYSCDVCNKMFSQKSALIRHQLIHSNVKPYSCDVCNKMFREKSKLITHQLIHSNLKPYSCDVCNKMFRHKSNLITHQLIHSNVKPYSCDVCKKKFRRKGDLIIHQLIHFNVKPYSCDVCNKKFRHKGPLKKHLLMHSKEKP